MVFILCSWLCWLNIASLGFYEYICTMMVGSWLLLEAGHSVWEPLISLADWSACKILEIPNWLISVLSHFLPRPVLRTSAFMSFILIDWLIEVVYTLLFLPRLSLEVVNMIFNTLAAGVWWFVPGFWTITAVFSCLTNSTASMLIVLESCSNPQKI